MNIEEVPLPKEMIEIFKNENINELYPPQEDAIKKVIEGKNVLVAIPTASGKSLIAYVAILRGFAKKMKSIYIVPLRALAMEKYEDLKKFEKIGLKVKLAIGDYDSSTKYLKDADVVVATSEKFDSITRHDHNYFYELGVIVIDEIHLLNDPDRGPTLEMILTKIKAMNINAQLISLSATVKNFKELAQWLDSDSIFSEFRPVPLKIGVYNSTEGILEFDTREDLEVPVDKLQIGNLIERSLENNGQTLIFVNTRRAAESLAERLRLLAKKYMNEEISELDEEQNIYDKKIQENAKFGVCFHHAGLSNEQRKYVEAMFKQKYIKVLVATPTLAAGVNLPARTVIVRDTTRYDGGMNVKISNLEIKQMLGRAGRPKYDRYGEAIVVSSKLNFEDLEKIENIQSNLGEPRSLRSHLLGLIASGIVESEEEILNFFNKTFFAKSEDAVENLIKLTLEFLEQNDFIDRKRKIKATLFGKRVSDLYLDPYTGLAFKSSYEHGFGELETLYVISSVGEMIPLFAKKHEIKRFDSLIEDSNSEFFENIAIDYDALKTAFMLRDWNQELTSDTIIFRYDIGPGDIHSRVEISDWLLYSYYELGKAQSFQYLDQVKNLWLRTKHGVKKELLPLVALEGVGRVRARRLFDSGFKNIESIKETDIETIAKISGIGSKLAEKIKKQIG